MKRLSWTVGKEFSNILAAKRVSAANLRRLLRIRYVLLSPRLERLAGMALPTANRGAAFQVVALNNL